MVPRRVLKAALWWQYNARELTRLLACAGLAVTAAIVLAVLLWHDVRHP